MMINKLRYIVVIALLLLTACFVRGQQQYRSVLLEEIGTYIVKAHGELTPGFHDLKSLPIQYEVRQDSLQRIVHLGVPLFSRLIEQAQPSAYYDFAERYILQQLLKPSADRLQERKDDKVQIDDDGILRIDTAACSITLMSDEHLGYINWLLDGKTICSMSFPKNRELITGLNKIEAVDEFLEEIQHWKPVLDEAAPVDTSVLEAKDDYYIRPGGYYIIEAMKGDTYYTKAPEGEAMPLFNTDFPNEALANLFNCLVSGNIRVQVTQNLYGFQKCHYTIDLTALATYFLHQGCSPYVGIEPAPEGKIRATIIYVNNDLSYSHLVCLNTTTEIITTQEGVIACDLFSFIPNYNLKSLYSPSELNTK